MGSQTYRRWYMNAPDRKIDDMYIALSLLVGNPSDESKRYLNLLEPEEPAIEVTSQPRSKQKGSMWWRITSGLCEALLDSGNFTDGETCLRLWYSKQRLEAIPSTREVLTSIDKDVGKKRPKMVPRRSTYNGLRPIFKGDGPKNIQFVDFVQEWIEGSNTIHWVFPNGSMITPIYENQWTP